MTEQSNDRRAPFDDGPAETVGASDDRLDAAVARSRSIGRTGSLGDTLELSDVQAEYGRMVGSDAHDVEPADEGTAPTGRPILSRDVPARRRGEDGTAVESEAVSPDAEPVADAEPRAADTDAAPVADAPEPVVDATQPTVDLADDARADVAADAEAPADAEAATTDTARRPAATSTVLSPVEMEAESANRTAPVPIVAASEVDHVDADADATATHDPASTAPLDDEVTAARAASAPVGTAATTVDSDGDADGVGAVPISRTIEVDRSSPRVSREVADDSIAVDERTRETDEAEADRRTFAPLGLSETDAERTADVPRAPRTRANRGFAITMAILGTLVFGALWAFAFAVQRALVTTNTDLLATVAEFTPTAAFWLPVAVFGLLFVVWGAVSNRAGWGSYVLGGLIAAALAYFSYHVGVALQLSLNTGGMTIVDPLRTLADATHVPAGLVAAIVAREVFTWVGGIIAARARSVRRRNERARAEYDAAVLAVEAEGIAKRDAVAVVPVTAEAPSRDEPDDVVVEHEEVEREIDPGTVHEADEPAVADAHTDADAHTVADDDAHHVDDDSVATRTEPETVTATDTDTDTEPVTEAEAEAEVEARAEAEPAAASREPIEVDRSGRSSAKSKRRRRGAK